MNIGEQIRNYRKKAGISQKELGERLGVSQQHIAQYENGKRIPKRETIRKIASALNMSDISLLDVNENDFDLSDLDFEDQLSLMMRHIIDHPGEKGIIHDMANGEKYRITAPNDKNIALKKYLLLRFEQLNDNGKNKLTDYAEDLTKIPEYKKENTPPQS